MDDERGDILSTMFYTMDLASLNEGGIPTFVRGNSRSVIDVSAVSENIIDNVTEWRVLSDQHTMSIGIFPSV